MNPKTQELLKGIAKGGGFTIEFPDGAPIRISRFPDGQPQYVNPDQPESDLVFAVLHTIALEVHLPLPMPSFLNRPYENERVGEIAYVSQRIMRQKLNNQWRAGVWTMCAYIQTGRLDLLINFLWRHPEECPHFLLAWIGTLNARLLQILSWPGKIFHSLFHSTSV